MPTKIDIIILSYAKTVSLKEMTEAAIESLISSEDPGKIQFNVIVIESSKSLSPFQYKHTTTIYPKTTFGYNKYMNIGVKMTHNKYVCLCNNDLIFHKNWASEILKSMDKDPQLLSATPYCPTYHHQHGIERNSGLKDAYFGIMIGWCIFVKREIFNIIGYFDENFTYWYCDNDYCKTVIKYKIKSSLVTSSFVTHLGSESLKRVNKKDHFKLTQIPRIYYTYKWHHQNRLRYALELLFAKLKLIFL